MTQAVASEGSAAVPRSAARSAFIVSGWYDALFFLGAPMLGLVIAAVLGTTGIGDTNLGIAGQRISYLNLSLGALINAHLVAVLFRSHGNGSIFKRHWVRFVVVPPIVLASIALSDTVMTLTTVVVVFWDAYHSALQTFGFARIYDARAGNAPTLGRRLDLVLNLVLYLGPIVGGAAMLAHFERLDDLRDIGLPWFSVVPVFLEANQLRVAGVLITGGLAFVVLYVVSYVRLARAGYRVAWPKVWLLASTGLCSLVAWGFNPWGLAFFITNSFHAVQYLALVWWSEGGRIRRGRVIRWAVLVASLVLVGGYGVWAHVITLDQRWSWAIVQTVALMHFWYDGFVWSVKKRDV